MRLFEAILEANQRAVAGDREAGVSLEEFGASLPIVALTCIDSRLNRLFPGVLGLPEEQFIWLRNAGNIVTGPMSSTMRSLALACAVKEAKEIAVIGHSDCRVRQTSTSALLEACRGLGIERARLPENLVEFFGLFASERQNVLKGVEIIRGSPLTGPRVPVHGLLVDLASGRLEWLVNGYEPWAVSAAPSAVAWSSAPIGQTQPAALEGPQPTAIGLPECKIGGAFSQVGTIPAAPQPAPPPPPPAAAPAAPRGASHAAPKPAPLGAPSEHRPLPLPPRLPPPIQFQRGPKKRFGR